MRAGDTDTVKAQGSLRAACSREKSTDLSHSAHPDQLCLRLAEKLRGLENWRKLEKIGNGRVSRLQAVNRKFLGFSCPPHTIFIGHEALPPPLFMHGSTESFPFRANEACLPLNLPRFSPPDSAWLRGTQAPPLMRIFDSGEHSAPEMRLTT